VLCSYICGVLLLLLLQIARVQKMLGDEYGTASNIKSRVNRLSVLGAITSAQQRLKLYNRVSMQAAVRHLLQMPLFDRQLHLCIAVEAIRQHRAETAAGAQAVVCGVLFQPCLRGGGSCAAVGAWIHTSTQAYPAAVPLCSCG
jgi:hypothetical protein